MRTQNNTNPISWTNVFSHGAFLRWQGKWWIWQNSVNLASPQKYDDFSIYSPDFFDLEKGFFKAELVGAFEKQELLHSLEEFAGSQQAPSWDWSEASKADFQQSFERIQSEFAKGKLKKAVPFITSQAKAKFTFENFIFILLQLLEAPDHLIPYGILNAEYSTHGTTCFLGATPEILYAQNKNQLQTMALAGTWPKNIESSVEKFLADPKENREHDWVVQDLTEKLQHLGDLQVGAKSALELPHLYHLRTLMQLQLKDTFDPIQFVKSVHPTAALGVFPSDFSYHWLADLPGQSSRGIFGAPICYRLGPDQSVGIVAIRGLEYNQTLGAVTLRAGCGLVEQSQFKSEWNELNQKLNSTRKLMKI